MGAAGAAALGGCAPDGSGAIRILVGSGAGSASDTLARVFADRLRGTGHTVAVENQPRGGGKLAAERLAAAPPDGRLMAFLPTGLLYAALLVEAGDNWDLARLGWLGSFGSDRRALVVTAAAGAADFAALLRAPAPITLAATAAASPGFYEPRIVRHLTGAPLRVVPGFTGGARNLSLISGETQGLVASLDGLGAILGLPGSRILLRMTDFALGADRPEHSPTLADVAHGADAAALIALVAAHARLGRILALPPGMPPPLLAEWRARVAAIMADAPFHRDAAARGQTIEPIGGAEVAQTIVDVLSSRQTGTALALRRALAAAA